MTNEKTPRPDEKQTSGAQTTGVEQKPEAERAPGEDKKPEADKKPDDRNKSGSKTMR